MSDAANEPTDDDLTAMLAAKPAWPEPAWEMPLRRAIALPEGGEIASLSLREPTEAEWMEAEGKDRGLQRRFLIFKVTGVPMSVLARVGIGDMVRAEQYLVSFFDVGRAIGVG